MKKILFITIGAALGYLLFSFIVWEFPVDLAIWDESDLGGEAEFGRILFLMFLTVGGAVAGGLSNDPS